MQGLFGCNSSFSKIEEDANVGLKQTRLARTLHPNSDQFWNFEVQVVPKKKT